jgi:hypothetical protein
MNPQVLAEQVDQPLQGELDRMASQLSRLLTSLGTELRILARGHGLVIQGRTRTYYAKQLVQHAVMSATTIPILANEIEVSNGRHEGTGDF